MTTLVKERETGESQKKMTLHELRKYDGQLFIQNNTANKITFHENMGDSTIGFELDPSGEPDSIGFLPKAALDMRGLQRLWMKGDISISTDPEMEEEIMLLNAHSVGVSKERMQSLLDQATDPANSKDLHEKLCLVCGERSKEGVVTRGRVLQSSVQLRAGKAPLCKAHLDKEHEFVPRLVSEKGEQHWEFDSVTLTKTNHGH